MKLFIIEDYTVGESSGYVFDRNYSKVHARYEEYVEIAEGPKSNGNAGAVRLFVYEVPDSIAEGEDWDDGTMVEALDQNDYEGAKMIGAYAYGDYEELIDLTPPEA